MKDGRTVVGHVAVRGVIVSEIGPCHHLPCLILSSSADKQASHGKGDEVADLKQHSLFSYIPLDRCKCVTPIL